MRRSYKISGGGSRILNIDSADLLRQGSNWSSGRAAKEAVPCGFSGSSTPATMSQWVAAFVRRLGELGWVDGDTVRIEYRWGEGRDDRFSEIAAEFVRLKVDVIVTAGGCARSEAGDIAHPNRVCCGGRSDRGVASSQA